VNAWRVEGHTPEQMRRDAAYEDALLRDTILSYSRAFRASPGHYLAGINAVMMMHVYRELTGDPRYANEAAIMAGGVAWAASCERADANRYWALANLGALAIIDRDPAAVGAAFREAIAHVDNDWLALEATCKHLALLDLLGFRRDNVQAALATLERAMQRLKPPRSERRPDKVFLFSGHMIDSPGRAEPRFPADREPPGGRPGRPGFRPGCGRRRHPFRRSLRRPRRAFPDAAAARRAGFHRSLHPPRSQRRGLAPALFRPARPAHPGAAHHAGRTRAAAAPARRARNECL
jgi:hypothetical protein